MPKKNPTSELPNLAHFDFDKEFEQFLHKSESVNEKYPDIEESPFEWNVATPHT